MLRNRSRIREKREKIQASIYYATVLSLVSLFLYCYVQLESLNADKRRLINRTRALNEANAELIRVMKSKEKPAYLDTME